MARVKVYVTPKKEFLIRREKRSNPLCIRSVIRMFPTFASANILSSRYQ